MFCREGGWNRKSCRHQLKNWETVEFTEGRCLILTLAPCPWFSFWKSLWRCPISSALSLGLSAGGQMTDQNTWPCHLGQIQVRQPSGIVGSSVSSSLKFHWDLLFRYVSLAPDKPSLPFYKHLDPQSFLSHPDPWRRRFFLSWLTKPSLVMGKWALHSSSSNYRSQ